MGNQRFHSILAVLLVALASGVAQANVKLPSADLIEPVVISANEANRWNQGVYEVWVLRGDCQIQQGLDTARSQQAVLWIERQKSNRQKPSKIIAYLEGHVAIDLVRNDSKTRVVDKEWLGRFRTTAPVRVDVATDPKTPTATPAIYQRALVKKNPTNDGAIRRTQFTEFTPPIRRGNTLQSGTQSIRLLPRSNIRPEVKWERIPNSNQWVAMITSGVNLFVDGLGDLDLGFEQINVRSIDVSTDRLVIWTSGTDLPDLFRETGDGAKAPIEIYMEGNIVFREGDRIIHADRMYYDVTHHTGVVLDAEMLTPVPDYEGMLRLKARVLRQTAQDHFVAEDLFLTPSRMGFPGYRLQADRITFDDIQEPLVDPFTGMAVSDPETGDSIRYHHRQATGKSNFLYVGSVPIFFWPSLTTDLTESSFYLRRLRVKNDNVFGLQVLSDWNGYQLFGIDNRPKGTAWDLSFDWLADRGIGHGTTFTYTRNDFLGIRGPVSGLFDYWGIFDNGHDNLGRARRFLEPEKDYRHRLFWQHRQILAGEYQLTAELGLISDRNFLEQYYEREWDELKDQTTGIELKHSYDNYSWSVSADARLNSFFTQTEWLPRGDHFWLGESLLGDRLTWFEHSHLGYARIRTATTPTDPVDAAKFSLLPWEVSAEGERVATRQEIDLPVQLGALKVVPYALGELAHWGDDMSGDDLQRAYGQAGVRASIPFWRVNPNLKSQLWNLNGVAHKMVFDVDFSWSDSSRNLSELPLYDPLDDDSIEAFRRRLAFNTFGGPAPVPIRFDERYYALRTGMASWVTSPSTEIADDLLAVRFGLRHRWQTKRGAPGNQRIIDWITLDTEAVIFPNKEDNFGQSLGLVGYDFRWHVGDRLTLTSDGLFDYFRDGQQIITVGAFLGRPPRGSLYLGLRLMDGPFSSSVLSGSYTYRMSEKWVSAFGMSIDLERDGNIGQNLSVTRIGESFLISAGVTVDASRNNMGAHLAIEPRYLPKTRLGRVGGASIPPAGAFGLE